MQKTLNMLAWAAAALSTTGLGTARAQDAQDAPLLDEVRAGAYYVHYNLSADDLSGPFTPPGINLSVDDVATVYLAYVRRLDDHWSVEFAGGIPPQTHTRGQGPATLGSVPYAGQEIATAKWFSPSVLLDYTFLDPSYALRPYAGAGLNVTHFYDLESTPAGLAANGGPTSAHLTNSWGPAATLGVGWRLTDRISAYASYSLARVNSHYTADTSGVVRETHIHFNPQAWVVSMGYAF
jgi:outer membrane protein